MEGSYTNRTVNELKNMCKEKGLQIKGKKDELVMRLQEYDVKNKYYVYVRTLMGQRYTIYLEVTDTVLDLKNKISMKNGCPVEKQAIRKMYQNVPVGIGDLIFPDGEVARMIENDKTLEFYDIKKGETLDLHIKM